MKLLEKMQLVKEFNYATGCLLNYPYLKGNYEKIAIELGKQQAIDLILKQLNKLILLQI